MAASLTGARYLRDAIVADSAQITGSAEFGGEVTVLSGISGDGSKLTGLSTWSPAPNTSTSIGISGVISRLTNKVVTFNDTGQNEKLQAVAYSPTLGLWVVVGTGADNSPSGYGKGLFTSPDGVNWTPGVLPSTADMWSTVAWGNGRFVSGCRVGPPLSSSVNDTMTSTDGFNWTGHTSLMPGFNSIIFNPDRSQFLGAGPTGLSVSSDGITWSAPVNPISTASFQACTWASSLGLYAAITQSTTSGGGQAAVYTSPDGIVWTQRMAPVNAAYVVSVCWSPALGMFIAVGANFFRSFDGITWTRFFSTLAGLGPLSILWDPDHAVFVAMGTGGLAVSPDGYGWQLIGPNFDSSPSGGIAYSSTLRQYVIVMSPYIVPPFPTLFTVSFQGQVANVTQSTATGYLGVGLGAIAPIQQLDVGGYIRVLHPYFRSVGVVGAGVVGGSIGGPLANVISVGNAYTSSSFYALANCVAMASCCANVAPGSNLQLTKTDDKAHAEVLAQTTNVGATYEYLSVSTIVPMTYGDHLNAMSGASIFDAGASFTGAMLFAT